MAFAKMIRHEISLDVIAQVIQTDPVNDDLTRAIHSLIIDDIYIKVEVNHIDLYISDVIVTYA